MENFSMKETNKIFRVIKVAYLIIFDILLAIFGWFFLLFLLFVCRADALYNTFFSYVFYVYFIIAFLLIVRNAIHRVKWYVRVNPAKMQCKKCHTSVCLSRYKEEHYLNSPISLVVPKINDSFRFTPYRVQFYQTVYRPYLQLDCPICGEKQVICPYCHESIHEESVSCNYEKPSICPHCGKKIYTPIPMREWKGGMYTGDILD